MENFQILLFITAIGLTTLLIILGFQVLMIVFEIRRAIKKVNLILDDTISGRGFLEVNKLKSILEFFKRKK